MTNPIGSLNRQVKQGQAYQKELRESGELDYRMQLVKQMQNGKITHKEAMEKLKKWKEGDGNGKKN